MAFLIYFFKIPLLPMSLLSNVRNICECLVPMPLGNNEGKHRDET